MSKMESNKNVISQRLKVKQNKNFSIIFFRQIVRDFIYFYRYPLFWISNQL